MNLEEFKVATKDQLKEYGDKIPLGNQYDENNNILTYKNSDGYWNEYTYNENNNQLTYKNFYGIDSIYIIKGNTYTLWYDINTKNYIAGCQNLSYTQCIKFFDRYKDDYKDAEVIMNAIEEHHKTVV